MFGFSPNKYSGADGKNMLFTDLLEQLLRARFDGDLEMMHRVAEYVTWVVDQDSKELSSAVDIAFFIPAFQNDYLSEVLRGCLAEELFASKWHQFMDEPTR